ncbi:phosphatase PAP2 family protein [Candidatus Pyrohabitans sp.]
MRGTSPHRKRSLRAILDGYISGGIFLLWVALGAYALLGAGAGKAAYLCAVMLLSLAVNTLLKLLFKKERPQEIDAKSRKFYLGAQRYAFPSAHVQLAFTALALIQSFFPSLVAEAVLLSFATLISRLYLGRHRLSDVVAGAALGYLLGYAGVVAYP